MPKIPISPKMDDLKHFNVSINSVNPYLSLFKTQYISDNFFTSDFIIVYKIFSFLDENTCNVAPEILLTKLFHHVAEDKNQGFYGMGQPAANAL